MNAQLKQRDEILIVHDPWYNNYYCTRCNYHPSDPRPLLKPRVYTPLETARRHVFDTHKADAMHVVVAESMDKLKYMIAKEHGTK